MKTADLFFCAAVVIFAAASAEEVSPFGGGGLAFRDLDVSFTPRIVYSGWKGQARSMVGKDAGSFAFDLSDGPGGSVNGRLESCLDGDGAVAARWAFTPSTNVWVEECGLLACLPVYRYADGNLKADGMVSYFAACGYNAIRIHHYDFKVTIGEGGVVPDESLLRRMDSLVDACVRHGLYITTDLFCSRGHSVAWRDVGIDADGTIDWSYKAMAILHAGTTENLKQFTRNFLCHRNVYTGRRLADEPALSWISLINEGMLAHHPTPKAGTTAYAVMSGIWKGWLEQKHAEGTFADDAPFPARGDRMQGIADESQFGRPANGVCRIPPGELRLHRHALLLGPSDDASRRRAVWSAGRLPARRHEPALHAVPRAPHGRAPSRTAPYRDGVPLLSPRQVPRLFGHADGRQRRTRRVVRRVAVRMGRTFRRLRTA